MAGANDLKGVIDVADFADDDKLGKGKEMVDKLTNLIAIFENPALDFSKNRAGGDRTTVGLNVEVSRPLPDNYGIRLAVSQRRTLGSDVFSPGFINMRRDQERSGYALTLTKLLRQGLTLKFQVRKVLNSENIELFEYENTVARVSMLWDFK